MKTKKIYIGILACSSILFSACTNGYTTINRDDSRLDEEMNFADEELTSAIRRGATYAGADVHQRVKALGIDVFAQYAGGNTTRNYTLNDQYQAKYWTEYYTKQYAAIKDVLGYAEKYEDLQNHKAIALIWRTYIHSMFTDYFGAAPYDTDLTVENPRYLALDEQYKDFFRSLDEAMATFDDSKPWFSVDNIYKGDRLKWRRFANTLRLRLAMKLSEIDEATCIEQVKKAFAGEGGIFQKGDDARLGNAGDWGRQYPYYMYQHDWGEKQVMMKSMEYALTNIGGVEYPTKTSDPKITISAPEKVDPRGVVMFDPSSKNKWVGMEAGLQTEVSGIRDEVALMSNKNILPNDQRETDIMLYAEACLLMAEAEERFHVGSKKTAQDWYEEGVKASFENWKLTSEQAAAYLTTTDKNPWGTSAKYDDAMGAGNTKLEKIVTQRYIAFYPDLSLQVWNDKRRLNLPAMMIPAYRDQGYGSFATDGNIQNPDNYISRTIYPLVEKQTNLDYYNEGVAMLDGGDKASSKLWWASKKSNYCTSVIPK